MDAVTSVQTAQGDKWFAARCILIGLPPDSVLSKFEGIVPNPAYGGLAQFIRDFCPRLAHLKEIADDASVTSRKRRNLNVKWAALDVSSWLINRFGMPEKEVYAYVNAYVRGLLGPDPEPSTEDAAETTAVA